MAVNGNSMALRNAHNGWLVGRKCMLAAPSLGLITLLGAFLRFYKLGAYNVGNAYYAATVQSMLSSWRNFFFVAFEPGGSVTVDKPPLGFWIQALSASVFGVNGFALALPQALAGVLAIPLLYLLVNRQFGVLAGLVAALTLAVMPITIATERNNTIDGLLLFVLLLATWAFLRAVRSGRLRDLLLGAVLLGLGFNIKMLQAFMPLPAFYALYLLGAPHRWWKRTIHLAGATLVLLVVSLSWAIVVDLTPADERPFVGSSTDNTVMELITGHNGIRRVDLSTDAGSDGGPPSRPPKAGAISPPTSMNAGQFRPPPNAGGQPPSDGFGGPPRQPGNSSEVGLPGWQRLFTEPLLKEASWLLPLALLGIPLVLLLSGWAWPLNEKHLAVVLWAGWLLPELVYFSLNAGLFHVYYLIMLGPPLAALVGAALWALARLYQRQTWLGWTLLAVFMGGTLVFQLTMLQDDTSYLLGVAVISISLLMLGLGWLVSMLGRPNARFVQAALGLVLASVIVAPLLWSALTTFNTNPEVWLPRSGPQVAEKNRPTIITTQQEALLDFLLTNTDPDAYLLATGNANQSAPYILATQRPVLTFGGFTGSDNVISVEQLAQMVAGGELRFVLGGGRLQSQKPEIAKWLAEYCTTVSVPGNANAEIASIQPFGFGEADVLYDCASQ